MEIVSLVDNYADVLLESTDLITRPPRAKNGLIPLDTFLGEHGLSLCITVWQGNKRHRILFDTGYTGIPLIHNADLLGLDLREIEFVVLSHAHMDHTGGINRVLDAMERPIPIVVHPDAFLHPRFVVLDDGQRRQFPRTLFRDKLEARKISIVESKTPVSIADETILVTGEVKRRTGFEKGLPSAFIEKNGRAIKDSIPDDQGIVIHLKGKGLVVVSGCSHAGIINTVLHAMTRTGEKRVHAIIGGFHLSGHPDDAVLERTVRELRKFKAQVLVPMHCTGWHQIMRLARAFPSSIVLNSVGSTISLFS